MVTVTMQCMYNSCKNDNSPEVGAVMPKHVVNMTARKYTHIFVCDEQILRTSSLVLIINFDLFISNLLVLTVNEVVG